MATEKSVCPLCAEEVVKTSDLSVVLWCSVCEGTPYHAKCADSFKKSILTPARLLEQKKIAQHKIIQPQFPCPKGQGKLAMPPCPRGIISKTQEVGLTNETKKAKRVAAAQQAAVLAAAAKRAAATQPAQPKQAHAPSHPHDPAAPRPRPLPPRPVAVPRPALPPPNAAASKAARVPAAPGTLRAKTTAGAIAGQKVVAARAGLSGEVSNAVGAALQDIVAAPEDPTAAAGKAPLPPGADWVQPKKKPRRRAGAAAAAAAAHPAAQEGDGPAGGEEDGQQEEEDDGPQPQWAVNLAAFQRALAGGGDDGDAAVPEDGGAASWQPQTVGGSAGGGGGEEDDEAAAFERQLQQAVGASLVTALEERNVWETDAYQDSEEEEEEDDSAGDADEQLYLGEDGVAMTLSQYASQYGVSAEVLVQMWGHPSTWQGADAAVDGGGSAEDEAEQQQQQQRWEELAPAPPATQAWEEAPPAAQQWGEPPAMQQWAQAPPAAPPAQQHWQQAPLPSPQWVDPPPPAADPALVGAPLTQPPPLQPTVGLAAPYDWRRGTATGGAAQEEHSWQQLASQQQQPAPQQHVTDTGSWLPVGHSELGLPLPVASVEDQASGSDGASEDTGLDDMTDLLALCL